MTHINARPGLNGNPPGDFENAGRALHTAIGEATTMLQEIAANVMHGRNYQTASDPQAARNADLAALRAANEGLQAARELASAVYHAAHNEGL